MPRQPHIILAAGGTGGHIYPALAIADQLRARWPQLQLTLVGARGGMETQLVPQAGYPLVALPTVGFQRGRSWRALRRNLGAPFRLLAALWGAYRLLRRLQPVAVVGTGGYASYPVVRLATGRKGCVTAIQEQNAQPGLANAWLGQRVNRVYVGMGTGKGFPAEKVRLTGNPVRPTVVPGPPGPARKAFGLAEDAPTITVLGGSLGAAAINEAMANGVQQLLEAGVQVIWQCGRRYADELQSRVPSHPNLRLLPYIDHMADAYNAADLVVCRAGALTLAELEAVQKPALLVPSPHVANDHQTANAQAFADRGLGRWMRDADVPLGLVPSALAHVQDTNWLAQVAQAYANRPPRNAVADLVDDLLALLDQAPTATTESPDPTQPPEPDPTAWRVVHFVGIAGAGMSALARHLAQLGMKVSGYDRALGEVAQTLLDEGLDVATTPRPQTAAQADAVVYTPAIGQDFAELQAARQAGRPVYKRAQVLGGLTARHPTLCVAGAHGKTSTSGLLAYLLHQVGLAPTAFVGGTLANTNSNYYGGDGPYWVLEADEFDRSFLHFHPKGMVLTSTDADHLDIYGDAEGIRQAYQAFLNRLPAEGWLLTPTTVDLAGWALPQGIHHWRYGVGEGDIRAEDLVAEGWAQRFTLHTPWAAPQQLTLNLPGLHNLHNALGALGLAMLAGAPVAKLPRALASYRGIRRRYELRYLAPGQVALVDDYAHHPTEIQAAIQAGRALHPGWRLVVAFQPHLYTRTRDFAQGFGQALAQADELLLLPIYPAREEPLPGVDTQLLLRHLGPKAPPVQVVDRQTLPQALAKAATPPTLLLTLGAGDIDALVAPTVAALAGRFGPNQLPHAHPQPHATA